MNDLTPPPGARDAVLLRARALRLRRNAGWATGGAAFAVVAVLIGGAAVRPDARDVVVAATTDPASPSPTAALETPTPEATTAQPTPEPRESLPPETSPRPTPAARSPYVAPPPPTTAPPTTMPVPSPWRTTVTYADEYVDDQGTRRAYPAAYGTCEYDRDPGRGELFPTLKVTASGVRVEGTTVYFTVTMTNTGSTRLVVQEETMVPMDALDRGTEQVTGTGTFRDSVTLRHELQPGDSVSAVHRLHAVTCAHSRGPRAPLPAGQYSLVAAALVYPGAGGEGGPVYAAPVTVTLP